MSNPLENKGIVKLGDKAQADTSKVVVVGTARGGTSLVAGVLYHLGIFMGKNASAPVFEDIDLSGYFESGDLVLAKKLVNDYSSDHSICGWKRPSSINYLETVDKIFEKPAYIFIYKDIVSIAQRNAISMLAEVTSGMNRAIEEYSRSLSFIRNNSSYSLLVSYEKVLSNPSLFVDSVIDFCDLKVPEDTRNNAIDFITPNPAEYLDKSRITQIKGRLDGFNNRTISGWARYTNPSVSVPVVVDIFINDVPLCTVEANRFRADLNTKYLSNCAFEYVIPSSVILNIGDVLKAKASGEASDLNNSPQTI